LKNDEQNNAGGSVASGNPAFVGGFSAFNPTQNFANQGKL
jgi:hypothetical protein